LKHAIYQSLLLATICHVQDCFKQFLKKEWKLGYGKKHHLQAKLNISMLIYERRNIKKTKIY